VLHGFTQEHGYGLRHSNNKDDLVLGSGTRLKTELFRNETETVGGRLSSDLLFLAAFWREDFQPRRLIFFQSRLPRYRGLTPEESVHPTLPRSRLWTAYVSMWSGGIAVLRTTGPFSPSLKDCRQFAGVPLLRAAVPRIQSHGALSSMTSRCRPPIISFQCQLTTPPVWLNRRIRLI